MKKRCRHPAPVLRSAIICGATPDIGIGMLTSLCLRCGMLQPLGPANDTPEVLVELRAAEIAALAEGGARLPGFCDRDEYTGWIKHAFGAQKFPEPRGERSGWLAREIATHGEEQG